MSSMTRRTGLRIALIAAFAIGCDAGAGLTAGQQQDRDPSLSQPAAAHDHRDQPIKTRAGAYEQLFNQVEALVKPYQDFAVAQASGYTVQLTDCMVSRGEGGMGFHYGNPAFIDGTPDALNPEVLLYEPRPNGKLQLVGIEYIVPYTLWSAPQPPELFGRPFFRNDGFQLWMMHVWVAKPNPAGYFATWNPRVSCRGDG